MGSSSKNNKRHRSSKKHHHHHSSKKKTSRYIRYGWVGFLVGLVVGFGFARFKGGGAALQTAQTKLSFDAAVGTIEQTIPQQGWQHAGTLDLNAMLANQAGVALEPRVRIIKMYNAQGVRQAVRADGSSACLLPDSVAVWEDAEKKVFVTRLKPSATRKMFGDRVAESQDKILERVLATE